MKDLQRVRKALYKKPLQQLEVLYKKASANSMVFYHMKASLLHFGVPIPADIEERYLYYWRLANSILAVQHKRVRGPTLKADIIAWEAKYGPRPCMWDSYYSFIEET